MVKMVLIVARQNNKVALCEKVLFIGARVEVIDLAWGGESSEKVEEEGEEKEACVKRER